MRTALSEWKAQALAEVCPWCDAPAQVWCRTDHQTLSRVLHQHRYAEAEYRAQDHRDAEHAANRELLNDPEGMTP